MISIGAGILVPTPGGIGAGRSDRGRHPTHTANRAAYGRLGTTTSTCRYEDKTVMSLMLHGLAIHLQSMNHVAIDVIHTAFISG